MPEQTKPSLNIDLTVEVLIGCIDLLESFGQSIHDKSFSLIVNEVLSALILGYQKDGKIPIYLTEQEIGQRFISILEDLGNLPESDQQFLDETRTQESIDNILQNVVREIEQETKDQLDSISEPLKEPYMNSETEQALQRQIDDGGDILFEDIPDTDKIKKELIKLANGEIEKVSMIDKISLGIVYTKLSREIWGTDRAKELQKKIADDMRKTAEEMKPS